MLALASTIHLSMCVSASIECVRVRARRWFFALFVCVCVCVYLNVPVICHNHSNDCLDFSPYGYCRKLVPNSQYFQGVKCNFIFCLSNIYILFM